ncbi:MAG: asparagine synthase (glutamine-hydrolyzing) [Verrucomicrobia bacterium]|nr:MAG: asparagine synthase (glutamine-hydrolyzing) [Verrucomicrobiota bacterium]
MCGIAGIINARLSPDELESRLREFENNLKHRGPDDRGHFISRDGIAGLANTRLAIQDLSAAGHQPMQSADGRYTLVFNGEIYNFKELRAELESEGEIFSSGSDTEVILRMYALYGPDCVREFAGMFGLAIWDELEKECFIARGALGIKPLYYFENDGALVLASEVRALLRSGLVPRKLCPEAVQGYLLFGAVPEPLTLIEGVCALPAGHYLIWRNGQTRITKFWDLQFGEENISESEAIPEVRAALMESMDRHLVSDVPVGVFLSGGIDSTTMVALASHSGRAALRTFCISFDNPQFNEGDVAARTAAHFKTEHSDWRLDSATAKSLLPVFLQKSDQPSIDGFNTFCVSKLAHDHGLKVVLSGLGGDELFGGYRSFQIVPLMVRASRLLDPIKRGVGELFQQPFVSSRTNRLGHFLTDLPITSAAYWAMRGIFTPREVSKLLPRFGCDPMTGDSELSLFVPPQPTLQDEVSYLEIARYMRNQLLRDSDVMSMAWSLELRVPFLDVKLISMLQKIPANLRLAPHKRLLLSAVPEIPAWVRERPKQGFAFPFKEWLTGEWGEVFQRINRESPIPLKSWYRSWCLFALESFLTQNKIELPGEFAGKGMERD